MGLIQRLPQDVVNRMAAGEVLARPCNAIKELVENSLDAGATEIMVNMQNGGLKLLQVSDNGKGIEREDFALVCERFATSKLQKFEDLMHMKTYGFRGEALASLSHVAKVNIVSKRADAKCAYQANFLDGKMTADTKPAAGKNGTCITATDLFYNLPTRRNKMTTHGEEAKMVNDTLLRFAIHRPDVSFALRQNQAGDFRTKGDGNFRDVVCNLLGRDVADTILPLSLNSTRLKFTFTGHISKPIASATAAIAQNRKTSRSFFSVFINGRSVRCDILKHPIDEVLGARQLHAQFCALHLQIDETRIDVNVHPTKNSVIFLEKEEIIEEIRAYFEKVIGEIFGFEALDVEKPEEEQPDIENLVMIPMSQSLKSIEAIRKPDTKPEFKSSPSAWKSDKKRVDYMEVRTDAKERKIDEFVTRGGAVGPTTSNDDIFGGSGILKRARTEDSTGGEKEPEDLNTDFDDVSMVSLVSTADGRRLNESQDLGEDDDVDFEYGKTHREFHFESIEVLRKEIIANSSQSLREMFKTSTFVGSINVKQVLIQFGTSLYHLDFSTVLREFFYQISVFSFGNYGSYRLDEEPPAIIEILELLGELSTREPNYAAFEVFANVENRFAAEKLLAEHADLLHDYFAIKLDQLENGRLHITEIPSLVHYFVPQLEKLPFLIATLVLNVDYDDEQNTFRTICRAIGDLFTLDTNFITLDKKISAFSATPWKTLIKEVLMPLVKRKFIPPEHFKQAGVIRQLADSHDLYKVFERCGT
ncbi:DNA mismatch repair protein S5 domain-containing protein [Caenorhabditis elegans]|uniref:DNA mismatch repair protein S5 domain-containing protein n=1 Tax=Caenorhabditis elegans TaxID=6239 RepID=Q9XU10_CAEEL|nr:DNA mismatch repair protein S5 domain-containing protein [Caenorhabditis elegans]CAB07283.2 DNA mismatch repair protein S5 domain-containing protein [Caenorhabditis elegans]|eukprot:NP_499796.2 MLH (MutL Homolog) family [Caenorhabditis elegans]